MENDLSNDQINRDSTEAYESSLEYLEDEFRRLDLLLHMQVLKQRRQQSSDSLEAFHGLVISEAEVTSMFTNRQLTDEIFTERSLDPKHQIFVERVNQLDAHIRKRTEKSRAQGISSSLSTLSRLFRLNPFEERCLVICLAPELGRHYEKVFAFLQDDVTRKKPSVDLVLNVLCPKLSDKLAARSSFTPTSSLMRYRLVQFTDDPVDHPIPLISRCLKLDDRIVDVLIGSNDVDARLHQVSQLIMVSNELDPTILSHVHKDRLETYIREHFSQPEAAQPLVFSLYGRYGSGRQALAKWVCHQLSIPLLVTDVRKLLEAPLPFADMVRLVCRETVLQSAALCLENVDCLLLDNENVQSQLQFLGNEIEALCGLTFLLGQRSWTPQALLRNSRYVELACPTPDEITRKQFWMHQLHEHLSQLDENKITELSSKFTLTPGQILDAIRDARNLASWRDPTDRDITINDLHAACQHQSSQALGGLAQKIEPNYNWDDIVLPDDQMCQLREIANHVKYKHIVMGEWGFEKKFSLGHGVTALFAGPSGTGKTMAAEILANALSLELYKIDLSGVVSKYIGETEKNLNQIFNAASDSNAILFFDEADALFGKRSEIKDAHDRYANIEIAYLLQKMEEYSGIVILTTNLQKNMDDAFLRRLRFIITFPFPDEKYREKIWLNIFPKSEHVSPDINFLELAKKIEISGGGIKNISLRAAYFAAEHNQKIQIDHLILASKYELKKKGSPYIDIDIKVK
jgi:SpoVK/Ycf46/Vps4 family AAA+-type ATPase